MNSFHEEVRGKLPSLMEQLGFTYQGDTDAGGEFDLYFDLDPSDPYAQRIRYIGDKLTESLSEDKMRVVDFWIIPSIPKSGTWREICMKGPRQT